MNARRGDLPFAVAALSAILLLSSCAGERDPVTGSTGGGTAIVALNAEMGSFNPLTNTDQNANEVNYYMLFTPLIQYDSAFDPMPYLAQRWDLEPDEVVFYLRRDVRWHDGRPVSAHDVKFTFDRAKDPETASILSSAYLGLVASAEVVDSFTIRFRFTRPHARPLDGFWWSPVPRHILADVPPREMIRADFNRNPIGSGPFRFVSWQSGESVTLERNPDFAPSLGGPPRLYRVIFRFVSEPATLLSETLTGNVDVNGSLFPHQAEAVRAADGVRLVRFPSREYYYIGWNLRREPFGDPRLRQALTMGIDRGQLIEVLLFGFGQPASGTIAPWHPLYPAIEPLPYDPSRADSLLRAIDWIDRDGDGVREGPGGEQLRFTLMTNHENPVRVDIAQIVQSQLTELGVAVDVKTLEWQTLLTQHRGRDFDGVVQSWVLDNFRVDPTSLFHSSQAEIPGSYNRSGLRDARVDSLMEAALATSDPDSAAVLWHDFALALQETQPFTFLMWLDELAAVSDRLRGVRMDARGTLVSVASWWIAGGQTARRR